jgi:hypothetical protein
MSPLLLLWSTTALAQVAGGTLIVNVPNAPGEIMLDGFPTGQVSPATMENVAPGTHLVELEYGCMVGGKEVTVAADKTTKMTLPMQYKGGTGTVRLKGMPYTATVLIDDAPIRSWAEGVEAKCGSRRIVVESPGFEDWATEVVITSGKWVTVSVTLVEAEIQETAPAPRPTARPVNDFEDDYDELDELDEIDAAYASRNDDYRDEYDELDDLDEPGPSGRDRDRDRDRKRERRLKEQEDRDSIERERRQQEQEDRDRAERERRQDEEDARRLEEERRRQAEADRRQAEVDRRQAEVDRRERQEKEERRSRYGDIDSLDDEEEPESTRGSSRSNELDELEDDYEERDSRGRRDVEENDFDDVDGDRFDESDEFDELDSGPSRRDSAPPEPRTGGLPAKPLQLGGTAGLAAVGIGGGVLAVVSLVQYSVGREHWGTVVDAAGIGSNQEVQYWELYVQPYKNRAIIGGLIAGVGFAAAGTWFFVSPDGTVQVGYSRRF